MLGNLAHRPGFGQGESEESRSHSQPNKET